MSALLLLRTEYMLTKILNTLFYNLLTLFVCLPVTAHEYWLHPDDFIINSEDNIEAHIKIGQNFKGNRYAYLPSKVKSITIHLGDKTAEVKPRLGDYPAISSIPLGQGLNIIALESQLETLNYKHFDKFKAFVQNEGIDWVLAAHKKRQLPQTGFTESYRRYTKSLIQVADAKGQDRYLGHEFEWLLLSNPYMDTSDEFIAQLWWRGQVFSNSQARLLIQANGHLIEKILTTDKQGKVSFKRVANALYLLNAVHIIEPDAKVVDDTGALWESLWASLTFATPTNRVKPK